MIKQCRSCKNAVFFRHKICREFLVRVNEDEVKNLFKGHRTLFLLTSLSWINKNFLFCANVNPLPTAPETVTQWEGCGVLCCILCRDCWPVFFFFEEGKLPQRPALTRYVYMFQMVFAKQNLNFQKSAFYQYGASAGVVTGTVKVVKHLFPGRAIYWYK
jgi:hypothetical protein